MSELIAHIECLACGTRRAIPAEALGERRGPALWRVLRCSRCGSFGKAGLRLIWAGQVGNPLAAGHGAKPQKEAS